jgi:DNA-binding MarR family transcriptional regulator
MKLFAGLRKIRDFQKLQLAFLRSLLDFDIVIEIGYQQERGQPMTLKQLFLLDICSRTTVRRKLARLVDDGIVIRSKDAQDQRASVLLIAPSTVKLLGKYGSALVTISVAHFG